MRKAQPFSLLLLFVTLLLTVLPLPAQNRPELMPLSAVKPGMKGVMYTIFEGDKVEAVELEVIGILPNLVGPKQDVVLVMLKGAKAEYTGVVAGMSGSPVYIEGKLVGALSMRFGSFSKDPLAGVTPIASMFEVDVPAAVRTGAENETRGAGEIAETAPQYAVPAEMTRRAGLAEGAFLEPIEMPLVFSGFQPTAVEMFRQQFSAFGRVATAHGGSGVAQTDDSNLKPGDMVGMVLVQGDMSIQAGCTVTAIVKERVFVCGHPLFGFGEVELPMARARVVTTLASSLASTKITNVGGTIGTITQDRLTAVMGKLGAGPKLIPVELTIATRQRAGSGLVEQKFNFEVIEHAKVTPGLIGLAAFNGLVSNNAYSEGMTFQLKGEIEIAGHTKVMLENMFAPTDQGNPDGIFVALNVQVAFARIYANPYEKAKIERIRLRVEAMPERRWSAIEAAWSEKSEVSPGEEVTVKVLLRPYRGAPYLKEIPIVVPAQAARGQLRLLVSDAATLNRTGQALVFGGAARLGGLESLIQVLNRERPNHRLYVTLLQGTPTVMLEDKEMPNAPVSQINVLDGRRSTGRAVVLVESIAGEWWAGMNQVIQGQASVLITVK